MAYAGLMGDLRSCLLLEKPRRLPAFLAATTPFDLTQLEMSHDEYATDADRMLQVHTWGVETFDYDWIFVHVDSCVALEPLGVEGGPKGTGSTEPWTPCQHLPANRATLEQLEVPDFSRAGRAPLVLKTIARLRERYGDSVCLSGHVTAPFSTLTYVFGTTETMSLIYDDPEFVHLAADFVMRVQLAFAEAQLAAGADSIWIGDLNSSSHLISMDHYQRFAYPPVAALVTRLREHGGISFYHQNEPDLERIVFSAGMMERGSGGVNIGQGADVYAAYEALTGSVCVLGGLDPWDVLRRPPEELEREVNRLLTRLSVHGGHIFNTGGQIAVETPPEHLRTILRAVRAEWR